MVKQKEGNVQQSVNQYSLKECERRPVERTDKWCKIMSMSNDHMSDTPAPYGYVVTIPFIPNQNTILKDVGGIIVRSKKRCGNFLLQVVPKISSWAHPSYGIVSFTRHEPNAGKGKRKNKKRLYRILSIRNLHKRHGGPSTGYVW